MSLTIALTGKGGVGKTTISSLVIRSLIEAGKTPVLAMDADPNSCLDVALGVTVQNTIGKIREETRDPAAQNMGSGISKQQLLALRIAESLVESDHFDLIAMGRPEGAGCYCFANNILKEALGQLTKNYASVVLDNEAGLENLSRQIVQEVDLLLMVGDATFNGIATLKRLYTLAGEMKIGYKNLAVIINRTQDESIPEAARELASLFSTPWLLALPFDPEIRDFSESGTPVFELSARNRSLELVGDFLRRILWPIK